jgi:hypothetical protein
MEKQYAKKEKNKECLGYQPNGIELDDSNPLKCSLGVLPLPPTPK